TGLGLAIARWAVDLHGGEIRVAEAERGCRILVTLPGGTPVDV
ncbi:ATP-binding protein, partial [Streptacidiphilus griseoplanus]